MLRSLTIGVAVLIAVPGLARAQNAAGGKAVATQPRHKGKVMKIDSLSVKQKTAPGLEMNPWLESAQAGMMDKKRPSPRRLRRKK